MKTINLLLISGFILISFNCKSQSSGLADGLAVKIPYDQMIQDNRQQSSQLQQAYQNFKQRYYNAVDLNNSQVNPKIQPINGWFDAVIDNGPSYFEKSQVYIENSIVTKCIWKNGKTYNVTSGGNLQNFRSVVQLGNSDNYEVILLMIMH